MCLSLKRRAAVVTGLRSRAISLTQGYTKGSASSRLLDHYQVKDRNDDFAKSLAHSTLRGGPSPSLRGSGAFLLLGVRPGLAGSSPRYLSTFRALIASTHLTPPYYFSANSRTTIVSFSSVNPCGFLMKSPYLSCSRNSTLEPSLKNVADLTFFGILGIASTGSCQFRM
jgi:hypothetical protein